MPFAGFATDGDYQGISSGYINHIQKLLGVTMTAAAPSSGEDVLDRILENRIDVFPCLAATPDRAGYLSFTRPYLSLPNMLMTRQKHRAITGLADMANRRVAVVRGDPRGSLHP